MKDGKAGGVRIRKSSSNSDESQVANDTNNDLITSFDLSLTFAKSGLYCTKYCTVLNGCFHTSD